MTSAVARDRSRHLAWSSDLIGSYLAEIGRRPLLTVGHFQQESLPVPIDRLIRFHSGRSTCYALATSGAHPSHSDPSYGPEPISLRWSPGEGSARAFHGFDWSPPARA
jgi:hypothetical protein